MKNIGLRMMWSSLLTMNNDMEDYKALDISSTANKHAGKNRSHAIKGKRHMSLKSRSNRRKG